LFAVLKANFQVSLTLLILVLSSNALSQCENADFEMGNWMGWTGSVGNCCPLTTPISGLVSGRHTIMTGDGLDPWACQPIPVVAPGGQYSIRLGNHDTGAQAERLQYSFDVTPQSTLITYKYAVIMEDPGHGISEQPRFESQLLDQFGAVIPCTFYQVAASGSIEGFESCGQIRSKSWTVVGVDVSDYIGSQVTLDIATGDCAQGGHFGYAYVDAGCGPLEIDARYCTNGGNLTAYVSAPEGFAQYTWSNGATTSEIYLENIVDGETIECEIVSVTGCTAELVAVLEPSSVNAAATVSSSCEESPVEVQNISTVYNAVFEEFQWISDEGDTTYGFENAPAFHSPGLHGLKLVTKSDAQCLDTLHLEVLIHPKPEAIFDSAHLCTSSLEVNLEAQSILEGNGAMQHDWWLNGLLFLEAEPILPILPIAPETLDIGLVSISELGCSDTTYGSIEVFQSPLVEWTVDDVCEGELAHFEFTGQAFSSGAELAWVNGAGLTFSQAQSVDFMLPALGANEISLEVTEAWNGMECTGVNTQIVNQYPIPEPEWHGDPFLCEGEELALHATSTVPTGWSVDHLWIWQGLAEGGHDFAATPDTGIQLLVLQAYNEPSCIAVDTIEIRCYPQPRIDLPMDIYACAPYDTMLLAELEAEQVVESGWVYQGEEIPGNPLMVHVNPGEVSSYGYGVITGDEFHQCSAYTEVQMTGWIVPNAQFTVYPNRLSPEDQQVECFADFPCQGCQQEWWVDQNWAGDAVSMVFPFEPDLPGIMDICLIQESLEGCVDMVCEPLEIPGPFLVYVPNAFTPDFDGLNDGFKPVIYPLSRIQSYHFTILNRWGEVVFESTNPDEFWIGNVSKGDYLAGSTAFSWILELEDTESMPSRTTGVVFLVR
jgi:hypothetical protein